MIEGRVGVPCIVGVSTAIREVAGLVDTMVRSDCCVLIEGETGNRSQSLGPARPWPDSEPNPRVRAGRIFRMARAARIAA